MRRLALLRHAKALAARSSDRARELDPAGYGQCRTVAQHLLGQRRVPQVVLCSSAVRTRQTWATVAAGLGEAAPEVRYLDELYTGDTADVLAALADVSDDIEDVLVVGHEPTISATAAALAGEGSPSSAVAMVRVGVPTATLCLLNTGASWANLTNETTLLAAVLTSPRD